jgi:hypothetical protein
MLSAASGRAQVTKVELCERAGAPSAATTAELEFAAPGIPKITRGLGSNSHPLALVEGGSMAEAAKPL